MTNIHNDLSLLNLGIHEARDLVQNRPLCRLMHATTGLAEAIIRRGGRWWHVTKYVYQKLLKSNNARSIYSWKRRQSFFETQSIWHMMGTSPVSMFSNKDMYCQKVQFRLIDWLYIPLDPKRVISETFPQASLLAWYGKNTKSNATKAHIHQSKKCTKTQKTDIRPGNGVGLFSKEKISKGEDK